MPAKEKVFNEAQAAKRLENLPGWYVADGGICRDFRTDGWPVTLMLVNSIGFFAEAADHHPDLSVSWDKVRVKLSTHSAGGITEKDMQLAEEIERIALWRPSADSALTGTPKKFVRGGERA